MKNTESKSYTLGVERPVCSVDPDCPTPGVECDDCVGPDAIECPIAGGICLKANSPECLEGYEKLIETYIEA